MQITRAFLSSIIEASDDAIMGLTLEGQIISWNRAAEQIYGYRFEEIRGHPLWHLILPERHDEIRQILSTIFQGQRISHFRTMHLRRDGQTIFVSLSISPLHDELNRCIGAALIARDITRQLHEEQALQETREKYQQIFHCESDAILLIDAKHRTIVEANDAAFHLYGYSVEQLLRRPFAELSVDREASRLDLARCLCGEVDHIPETRQRRQNGDEFTADISLSSILCSGRRLLVAIVRDVSERLHNQQLRQALSMAREIQLKLLPQQPSITSAVDLYANTRYCDEIGGDFYDYFAPPNQPEQLGFAVGDVSGHGVSAALLMALIKGVFQTTLEQVDGDLETLFNTLNRQLVQHSNDDNFMTLFYGLFNPDDHSLRWNSAGHGPVYWYRRRQSTFEELPATGYPLGINHEASFLPAAITVAPGDLLLVGTDGLWEARNPVGEQFGTGRVRQILASHIDKPAAHIYQRLMEHVERFTGSAHQEDDMTLMVIKFTR